MSVKVYHGDCREVMKILISEGLQVDCVVTSPPYWGLRSYLDKDDPNKKFEIGSEPSLGEHLSVMIEVFGLVRQLMKPTASLWMNYGDCYATTPNGRSAADTKVAGRDDRTFRDKPFSTIGGHLKPKDLCMIPNRLAIALQEDGWWVRSEIVWGKTNPMPDSSGKYRPSTAHEKIFLLSKTGKMYYDQASVALPVSENTHLRISQDLANQIGSDRANAGGKTNGNMKGVINKNLNAEKPRSFHKERANGVELRASPKAAAAGSGIKANASFQKAVFLLTETRYLRNYEPAPFQVWKMATQSFKEAHFATFPEVLPERCIKAGCPPGGIVFDPFGGSGTVGLVADQLQRNAILIDLKRDYTDMIERRITGDAPLFVEVERK